VSWVVISLGFLGLKMLMEQRPEFVGQPLAFSKSVLVQEAPRLVGRKASEDVSVIRSIQPNASEIHFSMQGRRDYRGLKTISDMSGEFSGRYTISNNAEEPMFVLFKYPHPRTEPDENQSSPAGGLKLQASVPGVRENTTNSWLWSGTIPARSAATIEISYTASSLKGITYRIPQESGTLLDRVAVHFDRRDLNSMRFESGDGVISDVNPLVWRRENFLGPDYFSATIVEGRNLFTSLSQLVEIGPLITLLFLLTVIAMVLTRQPLTVLQVLTIGAGYAFYYPLIIYLSSRFSFGFALVIAFLVPGLLLANYARWLLGGRHALVAATVFLALFQIFPTLAAFGGWNRGMVLLCLGVITFWVLISLQNRALGRRVSASAAAAAACFLMFLSPQSLPAAEVQVILPADLARQIVTQKVEKASALLSFEPAAYLLQHEPTHFRVQAKINFQAVRTGESAIPLFTVPVHLQESRFDAPETNLAQIVATTNGLGLFVQQTGHASLTLTYRVPITNKDGKKRAQVPLCIGPAANIHLESSRTDLEFLSGSLWSRSQGTNGMVYEAGAADEPALIVEWNEQGPVRLVNAPSPESSASAAAGAYGIGITRVQNLTIINSDGSCTHFTDCELPAFQKEEFRLRLPPDARLISASLNGAEINAPAVQDQLCRIRLPERSANQTGHRISLRLAYPAVRLGFVGSLKLVLPEVFETAGTLEWIVALPDGFEAQVISSGLEPQKTAADLAAFGDYGRVLKNRRHTYLAKTLAPPAPVSLNLKYRHIVPGLTDSSKAESAVVLAH